MNPCWIHAYVSPRSHCQHYSNCLIHSNVMWCSHKYYWKWFLDLHSCIHCSIVSQSSHLVSSWPNRGWVGQQQFDWSYHCCFDEVWGFNKGGCVKETIVFSRKWHFHFSRGEKQMLQGKSKMFGHPFQWVFIVKLIRQTLQ